MSTDVGTVGSDSPSWDALASSARVGEPARPQADFVQLLRFELDGSPYAVPVESIHEIVRMRPITPVPRTPLGVPGVISLRGAVVQVVDLRIRLRLTTAEPSSASRIVVVNDEVGGLTGLIVDAVIDVLRVTEEDLVPVEPGEGIAVESLCTDGEIFVTVIDLGRLLDFYDEC